MRPVSCSMNEYVAFVAENPGESILGVESAASQEVAGVDLGPPETSG